MTQPPIPEGELKQKLKAIIAKGDYDFNNGFTEGVLMLMTEAYELGHKAEAGDQRITNIETKIAKLTDAVFDLATATRKALERISPTPQ